MLLLLYSASLLLVQGNSILHASISYFKSLFTRPGELFFLPKSLACIAVHS